MKPLDVFCKDFVDSVIGSYGDLKSSKLNGSRSLRCLESEVMFQ